MYKSTKVQLIHVPTEFQKGFLKFLVLGKPKLQGLFANLDMKYKNKLKFFQSAENFWIITVDSQFSGFFIFMSM